MALRSEPAVRTVKRLLIDLLVEVLPREENMRKFYHAMMVRLAISKRQDLPFGTRVLWAWRYARNQGYARGNDS
jgi:hypothetical protein